jgi:DNA-binding NarL/FixJ family response regulator
LVDEVAVMRATQGDVSVALTSLEREAAIVELWSRGLDDVAIADRIGIADRTVGRIRKRLGLAAVPGLRKVC